MQQDQESTTSGSRCSTKSLVESLQSSIVTDNQNFDPQIKGDQLRLDLMYRWMRLPTNAQRPDLALLWFERLQAQHLEPQRKYHTLMHLEEMLLTLDILVQYSKNNNNNNNSDDDDTTVVLALSSFDQQVLVLATFFHDAIYDVHSSTNESDSASLFRRYVHELQRNDCPFPTGLESRVTDCILATQHHAVQPDHPLCTSIFLDLDMAVLGKQPMAYLAYAALIRQEYHHVPHAVYCNKRAEILEDFLKQSQIYGTSVFVQALEQRARDNVRQEIQLLRRGQIPGHENI